MTSAREMEKIIAEDETLFRLFENYIYDNPDVFEEDPKALALALNALSAITPAPAYDDGHPISRGQPRNDLAGHERGFASWTGNVGVAKEFASNYYGGVVVQSTGPVQGVKWENIIDHRMRFKPEESWYSGNHVEWFVINPPQVNILEGKKTAMKPFRTFLAEQEQDYEYKLCSVENIHTTEMMEKLRLALGRYSLIEMEPKGIQTQITAAEKSEFTQYPFMPVYVVKVVLANPLSSASAVQSVSLFTRIKDDKLKFFDKDSKIVMDGAENEQHAHPVEVDGKGSQAEVGDEHAKSLLTDLMKEITAKRDANTVEVPVYEGFTATHRDVSKILGREVRRGFYLAEMQDDGWGVIQGPFTKMPENYDYVTTLPKATVVESSAQDNLMEYKVKYAEAEHQEMPADAGGKEVAKVMQVDVTDQDTGKEHTVGVKATSANAARAKAVEILAGRLGISKDRLLPTSPTGTEN